jgi:lipoate-protein ligase B
MTDCHVIDLGTLPYPDAFELQKDAVERVHRGGPEALYFVEHPGVITVGRNATGDAVTADREALARRGVTVAGTDRGGDATYHGPGQLVGYPILLLEQGRRDIRRYVRDLEEVLIRTLRDSGIEGRRHDEHRGVWVAESKIASLGIRISRWVTCHGFALNVNTDLSHFELLHPCGIVGCSMTSMARLLDAAVDMDAVKESVVRHFGDVFGRRTIDNETAERIAHAGS